MKNAQSSSAVEVVLFGVLGDLSRRKLLPALYQLDLAGLLDEKTRVVGVARHEHSNQDLVEFAKENLTQFVSEGLDEQVLNRFLARFGLPAIRLQKH